MAEAPELAALYESTKSDNGMIITLMAENDFGTAPSEQELRSWAAMQGVTHPLVADEGYGVTMRFIDGNSIGLPAFHLLGPGAEVLMRNSWNARSSYESYLP